MKIVREKPIHSAVIGLAMLIAATVGIIEGLEKLDKFICTEAEAKEMIQQRALPVQRQQLEYQIQQMEYDLFILKRKKEYGKDEPWEEDLIDDIEEDIDDLEEKKDKLDNPSPPQ